MIFPRLRRNRRPDTISALYGMIVAQARLPAFYRDYAVADTVNGRFDLLVLHLALVVERLSADPTLHEQSQALFDRFCRDMDHNLREIGISDLKVPQEMRRMGEAFYGRVSSLEDALSVLPDTADLQAMLERTVYEGADAAKAPGLAAYVLKQREALRGQPLERLCAGDVEWAPL